MLHVDLDILMTRQPTEPRGCGEVAATKKSPPALQCLSGTGIEPIQAFRRESMSARNARSSLRAAVSAERSIFR